MLSVDRDFTILELFDLSLRVPEVGAVNFNVLHSALTSLVVELGLEHLRPGVSCMDEMDRAAARASLDRSRRADPSIRLRERRRSEKPVREMRERIKSLAVGKFETPSKTMKRDGEELRDAGESDAEEEQSSETVEELDRDSEEKKLPDIFARKVSVSFGAVRDGTSTADDSNTTTMALKLEPALEEASQNGERTDVESSAGLSKSDDVESEVASVMEDLLTLLCGEEEEGADARPPPVLELSEGMKTQVIELVANEAVRALTDSDVYPDEVIQKMWKVIKVDQRMGATEEAVDELSSVVDVVLLKVEKLEEEAGEMMNKTKNLLDGLDDYFKRVKVLEDKCTELGNKIADANELTRTEVARLEETIDELRKNQEMQNKALDELRASLQELMEKTASKAELEELKDHMTDMLETRTKELKKRILEVQDMIIPKEDFMELVSRVDTLEESKVSREELGRLLEPGFLENFISEHEKLIKELDDLTTEVSVLEDNLKALIKRIDDEILKSIEDSFAEINATIDTMKAKLDTLDADDINDTFARLEEQIEMFMKDLDHIKATQAKFEKEVKSTFKKISDVTSLLDKLEATKADKSKMYELLEMKADIEMLAGKLDKSEFVAIITEVQENLERLTTTVKINEEEMSEGFISVRHELSFKMYTEDFIIATEPIRNRIKAILYEQKKMKELILTNLFPDAPGVTKCFSCKRAANLAGPNLQRPSKTIEEVSTVTLSKTGLSKTNSKESSQMKLPPIDLDRVPIPPADAPRIQDIHQLPVLFAAARPQVGLAREKRKRRIDDEVAAYFASGKFVAIGGEYTRTFPQQKGLSFRTVELPQGRKSEVLLQGTDQKYYKGALYDQVEEEPEERTETTPEEAPAKDVPNHEVRSTVVVLKTDLESQPTATISVPKSRPKNVRSRIISSTRNN